MREIDNMRYGDTINDESCAFCKEVTEISGIEFDKYMCLNCSHLNQNEEE